MDLDASRLIQMQNAGSVRKKVASRYFFRSVTCCVIYTSDFGLPSLDARPHFSPARTYCEVTGSDKPTMGDPESKQKEFCHV